MVGGEGVLSGRRGEHERGWDYTDVYRQEEGSLGGLAEARGGQYPGIELSARCRDVKISCDMGGEGVAAAPCMMRLCIKQHHPSLGQSKFSPGSGLEVIEAWSVYKTMKLIRNTDSAFVKGTEPTLRDMALDRRAIEFHGTQPRKKPKENLNNNNQPIQSSNRPILNISQCYETTRINHINNNPNARPRWSSAAAAAPAMSRPTTTTPRHSPFYVIHPIQPIQASSFSNNTTPDNSNSTRTPAAPSLPLPLPLPDRRSQNFPSSHRPSLQSHQTNAEPNQPTNEAFTNPDLTPSSSNSSPPSPHTPPDPPISPPWPTPPPASAAPPAHSPWQAVPQAAHSPPRWDCSDQTPAP